MIIGNYLIELKYLNLLSFRLDKFKRKREGLWNCRCPLCGDSKKDLNKARGFFGRRDNTILYYCHNCNDPMPLVKLLQRMDDNLYKQYIFEQFSKKDELDNGNIDRPINEPVKFLQADALGECERIYNLPSSHEARRYVESRRIPEICWRYLWWTDTFKEFTNTLTPDKFPTTDYEEGRLIIAHFNEKRDLIGYQGRSLDPKSKAKYITINLQSSEEKLVFGLDKVDWKQNVYVTEGPIDSFFLDNSISVNGSSLHSYKYAGDHTIVLDNQPRNRQILDVYQKVIDANHQVVIWPEDFYYKDINEAICDDVDQTEILNLINNNTKQGLFAQMAFNQWKKI